MAGATLASSETSVFLTGRALPALLASLFIRSTSAAWRVRVLPMLHRLVSAFAWACLALIAFATLSPAYLRPKLWAVESDSIVLLEHVGAFALLGFLFTISHRRHHGLVFLIVFGSAIALELLQLVIPGRDARLVDAAEKLVGGGLGIVAAQCALLIESRRKGQAKADGRT
jgi:VanZ family protein